MRAGYDWFDDALETMRSISVVQTNYMLHMIGTEYLREMVKRLKKRRVAKRRIQWAKWVYAESRKGTWQAIHGGRLDRYGEPIIDGCDSLCRMANDLGLKVVYY